MDLLSKNESLIKETLSYKAFINFYEQIKKENSDISINKVNASCFNKDSIPAGTRCAGGVRKLSILPDGSVFPCNLLHCIDEFNLGNIFNEDFQFIWMNPKLGLFRKCKLNICSIDNCDNKHLCTGGCPAHGLYHYGDPNRPDIRCVYNHARKLN